MVSSEVQRTLVKSPPELWAELSDPAALARHLDEFGEIRITRTEPESVVEWEAADVTGTVVIKPSGWGTNVKLTVTRDVSVADHPADRTIALDAPEPADAPEQPAPQPSAETDGQLDAGLQAQHILEPELESDPDLQAEPEPEPAPRASFFSRPLTHAGTALGGTLQAELAEEPVEAPETTPSPEPDASEPRRGFFARLFGRRRRARQEDAGTSPEEHASRAYARAREQDAEEADDEGAEDETIATWTPSENGEVWREEEQAPNDRMPEELEREAARETDPVLEVAREAPEREAAREEPVLVAEEPPVEEEQAAASDLAAELSAAEEVAADQVTAVLTGVLDRLGAAHHRPFSRA